MPAREQMTAHFSTYERIPRYARMLSLGNKERMGDVHLVGDEVTVRARLQGIPRRRLDRPAGRPVRAPAGDRRRSGPATDARNAGRHRRRGF
jgi:hypothetical protein